MKSPTPKIHLLDVHEPLVSFHVLRMRCGAVLLNAQNEFMALAEEGESISLQGMCRQCLKVVPEVTEERVWIYGLSEKR